jgi:hypothetical protein
MEIYIDRLFAALRRAGPESVPEVGDALILLDVHAHVIVDFIEDAMPKYLE